MDMDNQFKNWAKDYAKEPDAMAWNRISERLSSPNKILIMPIVLRVAAVVILLIVSLFMFEIVGFGEKEYNGEDFSLSSLQQAENYNIYTTEKVSLLIKAYTQHN